MKQKYYLTEDDKRGCLNLIRRIGDSSVNPNGYDNGDVHFRPYQNPVGSWWLDVKVDKHIDTFTIEDDDFIFNNGRDVII